MDTTAGRSLAASALLVRRAVLDAEHDVAALLRDVPLDPREVADLIRQGGVFVLADLTRPLSARPVAAAAVRYDRAGRTAQLVGVGVLAPWRRRGLGCRLLAGILTLLRAEGLERVYACTGSAGAGAALLASAGFAAEGDAERADGRRPFVLAL